MFAFLFNLLGEFCGFQIWNDRTVISGKPQMVIERVWSALWQSGQCSVTKVYQMVSYLPWELTFYLSHRLLWFIINRCLIIYELFKMQWIPNKKLWISVRDKLILWSLYVDLGLYLPVEQAFCKYLRLWTRSLFYRCTSRGCIALGDDLLNLSWITWCISSSVLLPQDNSD